MKDDGLGVYHADVPVALQEVPGVKRFRSWRVPYNTYPLVGWPLPAGWTQHERVRPKLFEMLASSTRLRHDVLPLREPQVVGLTRILPRTGYNLWDPPGSGKTRVGLTWLAAFGGPRLVVTRAAIRGTWADECQKWTTMNPHVLVGRTPEADQLSWLREPGDHICIATWEVLLQWRDILADVPWRLLVVDESHWTRRRQRVEPIVQQDGETVWRDLDNASASIRKLAGVAERRLCITATPLPNVTMNLWPQLDLAEPWCWGGSFAFGQRYCAPTHNGYGWAYKGLSNKDELAQRIAVVRRRASRAEVYAALPPKSRRVSRVDYESQDRVEAGFKRELAAAAKRAAAEDDPSCLMEVLLAEACWRKRSFVVERVLERARNDQKVTVFTGRRKDCERLGEALRAALDSASMERAPLWHTHGESSPEVRDRVREQYMATKGAAVLVATGDSMGEGVNLQDTDLALMVMLPYTPEKVVQWEGRFYRLGMNRPVEIEYVVASGTVDEDVARTLLNKLDPVVDIAEEESLISFAASFRPPDTRTLLERVSRWKV